VASTSNAKARLPKITLPKFRGNVTNWTSFWESFKLAMHKNTDILKIDKFNYLNSLLEGLASCTVQGLNLTEPNYDSAVELLQMRFGNPQQIITTHMDELLMLPNCVRLLLIYDKTTVHVRGLHALGIDYKQYGSLLIPVIMSKVPNDIRLRMVRENQGGVWDLDKLMTTLLVEVEAQEASESTKVTASKLPYPSTSNSHSTASSLVAGVQTIQCVYCCGNHYCASCNVVKSIRERKELLT